MLWLLMIKKCLLKCVFLEVIICYGKVNSQTCAHSRPKEIECITFLSTQICQLEKGSILSQQINSSFLYKHINKLTFVGSRPGEVCLPQEEKLKNLTAFGKVQVSHFRNLFLTYCRQYPEWFLILKLEIFLLDNWLLKMLTVHARVLFNLLGKRESF